jgi:hypothetical protein
LWQLQLVNCRIEIETRKHCSKVQNYVWYESSTLVRGNARWKQK